MLKMVKQVIAGPFPVSSAAEGPAGLCLAHALGVGLEEQLCWCLAKVVDDGLNLSSLPLILNLFQVYIVCTNNTQLPYMLIQQFMTHFHMSSS